MQLIVPRNERQHLADVNHTDTNNKRDVTESSKKPYNYANIHTGVVVPRSVLGTPYNQAQNQKRETVTFGSELTYHPAYTTKCLSVWPEHARCVLCNCHTRCHTCTLFAYVQGQCLWPYGHSWLKTYSHCKSVLCPGYMGGENSFPPPHTHTNAVCWMADHIINSLSMHVLTH